MATKFQATKLERERLERLAAFASAFRDPQTAFGRWHPSTGQSTTEDPRTMPWFEMSEVAGQFIDLANGFIETLKGFDWTKWIHQPEGRKLCGSPNAIRSANGEQLVKLSLALVRQDRFCEGTLAKAYDDKSFLRLLSARRTYLKPTDRGDKSPEA